ncbi:MBL fold metallo-hydrolase [Dyella sp. A6]|uniref:MBL fold metallo-hydrolase n=1 Tax=Dyella aluminiiresistens TaxID=3069105 RepID=UPI002E78A16C|nr:MBL fold metallo-hydrolase [Dyella sp. A6]
MQVNVIPFRHEDTATWTYLVHASGDAAAAVIDPVLDYDAASGEASTGSAARVLAAAEAAGLRIDWILETHAHADHLSAAAWLRERTGARVAIGAGIVQVQHTFKDRLHLDDQDFVADGRQFDHLLNDGEELQVGALTVLAVATPGHTADSMSYVVGDAVFVGDTLFSPASGSARCDFPGGDAHALYRSVHRLYELPVTRMFLCHDYPAAGTAPRAEVPVSEQRAQNIHLRDGVSEAEFVAMRTTRDAGLAVPRLLWPSLQVNIRAGHLPEAESNGGRYLRLPVRLREASADGAQSGG